MYRSHATGRRWTSSETTPSMTGTTAKTCAPKRFRSRAPHTTPRTKQTMTQT